MSLFSVYLQYNYVACSFSLTTFALWQPAVMHMEQYWSNVVLRISILVRLMLFVKYSC